MICLLSVSRKLFDFIKYLINSCIRIKRDQTPVTKINKVIWTQNRHDKQNRIGNGLASHSSHNLVQPFRYVLTDRNIVCVCVCVCRTSTFLNSK